MDSQQLVTLRTEIREIEARLKALAEFARDWDEYAARLRKIADRLNGYQTPPDDDPELPAMMETADDARAPLRSRMATVLSGGVRNPMAAMLTKSLRSIRDNLIEEFFVAVGTDNYGGTVGVFSVGRANELLVDCKSILGEKRLELEAGLRTLRIRLEELERAGNEAHERELEKIRAQAPHLPKWIGRIGRFFSWVFEDRVKTVISGLIILALLAFLLGLFPGTRPVINKAIRFITSQSVQDTIPARR